MGLFGPTLPMSLYDLLHKQMRQIADARFRDEISAEAYERMHLEILKRIDKVLEQDGELGPQPKE